MNFRISNSTIKSPCNRDCPDRTATCKLKCFKWAYYEMEKDIEYKENEKSSQKRSDEFELEFNRSKRIKEYRNENH